MEPERQFAEIRALMQASEERASRMELRFNERMNRAEKRMELAEIRADRADRRMDRAEKRMNSAEKRMDRAEKRMDRADERMDRMEKKLDSIATIVRTGMRMLMKHNEEIRAMRSDIRELIKAQKLFLDSLRGRNGEGHMPIQ